MGAPPAAGQFDDISAETDAGTWSVTTGRLSITRTGSSNDAGFARVSDDVLGNPDLLRLRMDFDLTMLSTTWSELFIIELGKWSSVVDYNGGGSYADIYQRLMLKGGGTDTFRMVIGSITSNTISTDGSTMVFNWYINKSGSATTYTGPDGLSYALADATSDIWIDDTRQLAAIPYGTYSSTEIQDFRYRFSSNIPYTIGIDSIAISDFLNDTTNEVPVAANDSASTNEEQSVQIDVLANDSDADEAPEALSIVSVTAASNGEAVVNGTAIDYTPDPGFYGQDSFTYTITDGADEATATVSITVTDTSQASDLTSGGLGGAAFGAGSGSSRILANDDWEITAEGTGSVGTSDDIYAELASVEGDFALYLRVIDLISAGADPMVGLCVRETAAADAAMAQISIRLDESYTIHSRLNAGQAATQTIPAGTATLPDAWLVIERVGDTLSLGASSDGQAYTILDTVDLLGLADTVLAGIAVSSGTDGVNARAVVSEFAIEQSSAIFLQNFESSALVADYQAATPGPNQFNDISAEADGGTWSVTSGVLTLDRTGSSASTHDAGFANFSDPIGDPAVVKFAMDLSLAQVPTTWSELFVLELGDWSSQGDYSSGGSYADIYQRLQIKGSSTDAYKLVIGGLSSAAYPADGQLRTMTWYINKSGVGTSYVGPDAQTYSLADATSDIWVGTSREIIALPYGPFSGQEIQDFRVRVPSSFDITLGFDNITIEDSF